MWVSSDTKVGNTSGVDYDINTWNNQVYGSIKVNVTGDFEDKRIPIIENGSEYIISTVNDGGLVAVNNQTVLRTVDIREYRYSGPEVNNYIIFNDDGDSITEANELWRIVGVFKNSEGNWNLKLMRDSMLTSEELPATYKYNGTTFNIEGRTAGTAIKLSNGTNQNDWTTTGLQYFLNTNSDTNGVSGYYSTFTQNAKKLIDENYEYNLGNVKYQGTTIEAYEAERGTTICDSSVTSDSHNSDCNIWNGNQPTWHGAIGLLYPSDYGYSSSSEYWNVSMHLYSTAQSDGIIPANTSWMQVSVPYNSTINSMLRSKIFLSPGSSKSNMTTVWFSSGYVNTTTAAGEVHPVLYLTSEATINCNREGSKEDPYVVIES